MKHTVILSGGLDSTVALEWCLQLHPRNTVRTVTIDYGQRHRDMEIGAARRVAEHYDVPHDVIDLQPLLAQSTSSLVGTGNGDIPKDQYDEASMASTVVHGRNLLFAAAALTHGGPGTLWLGVHGGDHHLYPDCRPEFWHALTAITEEAYGVEIMTPFLNYSKAGIVERGQMFGAPFELTYSCYEGGPTHCGQCGTCTERRQAFITAGVTDPTEYGRHER